MTCDVRCVACYADRALAGAPLHLYYNRHWGPIRSGSGVGVKAGFNGWTEIVEIPLRCRPAALAFRMFDLTTIHVHLQVQCRT